MVGIGTTRSWALRLAAAFAIAFFLLCSAALAQYLPPGSAIFLDPSRTLGIADVQDKPFETVPERWSGGYLSSAIWVRLDVAPSAGRRVMRIGPPFLDHVDLYSPDPSVPGGWQVQYSGDRVTLDQRPVPGAVAEFWLDPETVARTFYVRVQTTSSTPIAIEVLQPLEAQREDLLRAGWMVAFLAMMVAVLIGSVVEYIAGRDRLLLWFIAFQLIYLGYSIAIVGYLPLLLPGLSGAATDWLTSTLVMLVGITGMVFHRALMQQYAPHALVRALSLVLLIGGVANLIGSWIGFVQPALQLQAVFLFIGAPLFALMAFTARREGVPSLKVVRAVYVIQTFSLMLLLSPVLGLGLTGEWSVPRSLVHGVLSAFIMYAVLYLRARERLRVAQKTAVELTLARQQIVFQQNQRAMQDRFLAMLVHELKTPLTVARFSSDSLGDGSEQRATINGALDNMNAIIDRCAYADQMEQGELGVEREPVDLLEVIDTVIERHGAAGRVRVVRDIDGPIETDATLAGVVIANLVENALKYSPQGSEVLLRVENAEISGRPGVAMIVENDADRAGLPDAGRVFDKFYRSRGARSRSGSGLGLYIVRGIVELLGGTVQYEPGEARARFRVWLPC